MQDTQNDHLALQFLARCKEFGVFADDCDATVIHVDFLDGGLLDSMSAEMLIEMIKIEYGIALQKEMLVGELRTLALLSQYVEQVK